MRTNVGPTELLDRDRTLPLDGEVVKTSESPKLRPLHRLQELWSYREILANLTRKEIKVKYTSSKLGAAWSMLNPLLYLAVFGLVFSVILPNGIPDYTLYLLTGLLAWTLFSTALTGAARSVVENANLVKKVAFPKELLPFASVASAVFDFLLQAIVLVVLIAVIQYPVFGANLLLLPLAMLALLLFATALSFLVAGLNVRYRDTQHLLNVLLLAWFWLTPVVYPAWRLQKEFAVDGPGNWVYYLYLVLNPMADIIAGFQRAIYRFVNPPDPVGAADSGNVLFVTTLGTQMLHLLAVIVGSIVLMYFLWRHFFRLSGDFAEEL